MPSTSRARRGIRALVATSGLALTATSLALVGPPAQAAATPNVYVNVVATNDFHGRIDGNTVAFAGTVEEQRAAASGPVLLDVVTDPDAKPPISAFTGYYPEPF